MSDDEAINETNRTSDIDIDVDEVDVVVVGGGLAGLSAAATAAGPEGEAAGRRVVVLDTRAVGGRARTDVRQDFHLNQGPRALYRGGAGRAVLGRLRIVPTGGPPSTDVHGLFDDGSIHPLPGSARRLVTSSVLSVRSKAQLGSLLARLDKIDTTGLAHLSIAGWLDELDLRPDARALVETIFHVATYVADLDTCSADAGVRQVQMALGESVTYLDGGWQQIVDALVGVALGRGVVIRRDQRVLALDEVDGRWLVSTPTGQLRTRSVVLAVGSPSATARLLPTDPSWELGPDTTAACLDLGLRRPPTPRVLFGVGRPLYLSTHCPPATLAPDGHAVVHVLRYGARTAEADAVELWGLAAAAGITEADVVTERFLHRMVVSHALPAPGRGLAGRPAVAVPGVDGVWVAGDWVGPVGMLADASLSSGELAGRSAADHASYRAAVA
jgi:phytoene dehydrogenase-like protein